MDHYKEISQGIREVTDCISGRDFDGAIKKYEQMSALIGERQLKNESIR